MGLTKPRASQIFDIDYKQATRVITVSNVTLSGGAPSVVDGVSLVAGDRVLVTGQTTGSQNGLYAVSSVGVGSDGTWVRTSDGNEDGEIQAGMIVMVTEGATYADTQWKLTTDNPIDIGTTALTFARNNEGGGGGGIAYTAYTQNATLTANQGAIADTTGGAFTLTLPASPSTGDQIVIVDGTDSFATNNLTVGRNGNTIEGIAEDLICDINGVSITFIYNGTTWSIYTQIGAQSGVVVTEDGIQTLTNKTLVDPTIQNYTESVVAIGTVSTTHTFDLTNGTMQTATLTASTACTFTMPTAAPGKSFILILNQAPTTGNGTATFTGVLWAGGSAPTITAAAGSADMISFVSDGTNWYGSASQDFQ